ncbi:MAG: hypothetical protein H7234_04525 [Herminiimonas sp.]|nr:hypothetical protein [Herminiimonas sp.]
MPVIADWPTGISDVIGPAPDLKRVFDAFAGSTDARQRRIAVRAFDACVPAFLPGDAQPPSPENLIAGLPADQHAQREEAYRALFARCHRLLSQTRTTLNTTRLALARDVTNMPPGVRAQERVLAGETTHLDTLIGAVLGGGDANDLADLAGISSKLLLSGGRPDATPAALQYALETDAALLLASCDLGRDCSAQSLWALQLCAGEGRCDGDISSRLVLRNTHDGIDATAVDQRRHELVDAIRSGKARKIFALPLPRAD